MIRDLNLKKQLGDEIKVSESFVYKIVISFSGRNIMQQINA